MKLTPRTASDIETAGGLAEWALLGNREALKGWAALLSVYLHEQATQSLSPLDFGFSQGYPSEDARHCLQVAAQVFESIHRGDSPDKAFGYKRARGRPPKVVGQPVRASEDEAKAEDVARLRADGESLEAACKSVAHEHNDSPERIKRLLKRNSVKN